MKRRIIGLWLWLGLMVALLAQPVQAGHRVVLLTVEGAITPSTADYIERGLRRAEEMGAAALLIRLDTPGGDVGATLEIMQSFENAAVPVIVYVAPRGAQAMSAGTYITLAAHAAAMTPHTTIGAAHPVGQEGEDLPATLDEKLVNALVGRMNVITRRRGEEAVAWAERAVRESIVATDEEALEIGLVDVVADDVDALLTKLDGHEVETVNGSIALALRGAEVVEIPPSPLERLLHFLTDPNVVAILLVVGVQAILIELSAPGGWVAGFLGTLSLVLAAYGIGILPVNWLGMAFIVIAFVLFILDIKAPTHGALTLAGTGSLIAGLLVFFNAPPGSPYGKVSVPLVIALSSISAAIFAFLVVKVVQTYRKPPVTGREGLLHAEGITKTALKPEGIVFVQGERWQARSLVGPLPRGTKVRVAGREGFILLVEPVEPVEEVG